MQDGFQRPALVIVGEHQFAQGRPVQATVCADHPCAEGLAYRGQSRRSRFHDLAGDQVGINDRHAERREVVGDRRLAAGDAAGQANVQGSRSGFGGDRGLRFRQLM